MYQKYFVELSEVERQHLEKLISAGTLPARTLKHAFILLHSDCSPAGPHWTYEQISAAYQATPTTIRDIRRRFVEGGLAAALYRKKPERRYQHALDGEAEAHLIAMACGKPPEGQKRWTLRLLCNRFIRLGYVDHLSHETVRTTLKKIHLSLG